MRLRPCVLAVIAIAAAACGGNLATEDPLAPIPSRVDASAIEPPPLRVEWRRPPEILPGEDDPVLVTRPTAVGATLAYLPRGREMVALRLENGTEAWRLQLGVEVVSQPLADAEGVAVPTSDGWLLLDETGRLRAALRTAHPARAAISTADGVIQVDVAGIERLRLRPAEAAGSMWRTPVENAATLAITADGSLLIVVDDAGAVTAHRASDGGSVWRSDLVALPYRPAMARDHVVVVGDDHRVHALQLSSGKQRWISKEIGIRIAAAPVVVDDLVWVPGLDAAVHAYSWGGSHQFRVPVSGRIYVDLVAWDRWVVVSPQYGPWSLVRAPLQRNGPGDPGQPGIVTISSDGELSVRPGVGAAGVTVTDEGGAVRLLKAPLR